MTETQIRLTIFLFVLITMSILEAVFPAKDRLQSRGARWFTNMGLVLIDSLVIRLFFPIIAVGAAFWAQGNGWGVFNLTSLPGWLSLLLSLVILDVMIYWQHVAFHRVPALWRVHKIHHADRDLDASSGLRFHPVEIMISMIYKIGVVILIGAPVLAVIIFEILLNACALFNHTNVRLPNWLERILRHVFVTPSLHRIHHSTRESETNTNYGFSVIWWDKIFGTFTDHPEGKLVLGLTEYQTDAPSGLWWSLITPFKRE